MHVLQWIATEADNKDEAYATVEETLQNMLGDFDMPTHTWYDWFVVGGGRWNTEGDESSTAAYTEGKTNLIISYDEDPVAFRVQVLRSLEDRKSEFDNYAKDVDSSAIDKIITDYDPKDHDFLAFQTLYPIKKIIDMAYGTWDFNSYFFDMVNDSTTPKYLYESLDKGNKNWYLVPVDFHFQEGDKMTMDELIEYILRELPNAVFGEEDNGEILIATGLVENKNGTLSDLDD